MEHKKSIMERTADLVTVMYPKINIDSKDNNFVVNKTTEKKTNRTD